jgi:peptidoglycan-associated lipoprotein
MSCGHFTSSHNSSACDVTSAAQRVRISPGEGAFRVRVPIQAGGSMKKFAFAAMVAFALVGCSSNPTTAPVEDKSATTDPAAVAGTAAAAGTTTRPATTGGVTGASTGAATGAAALKDPNNILSKREVFFEFDSFVVTDKYKPMVEAHARYLSGNRAAKVTLHGHGDERGAREYNIALGQRRADAVKRMMTLLGVQEIQIETVSFGEEKPRNLGHDETAWTENRRVDIVYAGE